jgi:hypothetical protein
MNYTALKAEILTGPLAASFVGKSDNEVADKLNDVTLGGGTVNRGIVPAYEIINATVSTEWAALTAAEKQRYQTMTGAGQVDTQNANVRAAFQAMFGAGTATITALAALLTRPASRAELSGLGTVSYNDVNIARAL